MNDIWVNIKKELSESDEAISKRIELTDVKTQNLDTAICLLLAKKIGNDTFSTEELLPIFKRIVLENQRISQSFIDDIEANYKRDYACNSYSEIVFFKQGFQVLCAYRFANYLYLNNQLVLSKWLQNRMFEVFSVDIHPAATIGKGLVIDHAIGIVIGETTIIEDNVFMFHNVTLGGTGKLNGQRHPKVCSNVVIGANSTILGNIVIHKDANIAAGSVVLKNVVKGTIVAGVPAVEKGLANTLQ